MLFYFILFPIYVSFLHNLPHDEKPFSDTRAIWRAGEWIVKY